MKVLIGCEESGYLRSEFRRRGHKAWSCDWLPAADGSHYHLESDVMLALDQSWDLIILHPPCTYMCVSGNRHYADTVYRARALEWTQKLWLAATATCNKVCIEQPVSVYCPMDPVANKQVVHPYQFGCAETKTTVLYTIGLPPLVYTNVIPKEVCANTVWRMPPSSDRSRLRGHLPWLAAPIAEQWGAL